VKDNSVHIIGAGPAGLSAAYELVKMGGCPIVLEKTERLGGIARTETYLGNRFDIGGHRFFSKDPGINNLWLEMLGEDLLRIPRRSRIYYKNRLFNYPVRLANVLSNLGPHESMRVLLSYLNKKLRPHPEEKTFEQWVSNRFGGRLYEAFFRAYTEKIWGIACSDITADWAVQRIKGLSLSEALRSALFPANGNDSLVKEFLYPREGAGMLWQRVGRAVAEGGGRISVNSEILGIGHDGKNIRHVSYKQGGEMMQLVVDHLISSMSLPQLLRAFDPLPPGEVLEAAGNLRFRAFIQVVLVLEAPASIPDQWIYINNPEVKVGRIQFFHNWSPELPAKENQLLIGMEYFCNRGDDFWEMDDTAIAQTALMELAALGIFTRQKVCGKAVIRQPRAYPVYSKGYDRHLGLVRQYLQNFKNFQTIGRNGMHRYNNMDHAMLTGILAARNIHGGGNDLWSVNEAGSYLEQDGKG
jgi:protoporphyrinogen oxidase